MYKKFIDNLFKVCFILAFSIFLYNLLYDPIEPLGQLAWIGTPFLLSWIYSLLKFIFRLIGVNF